ncbi:phosphohistidine phosphatase SixA [Alcanivorax sp. S6407]|uniref:phosphohistidine phosphatase SixA n=1 Tax=Alcanivorax sp. S6407 TaxID=2926424 RepID=UPI001FF4E9C9|nr:phosphohistidine phosphatase SixA [Alcanivorax sp. S6407]MCK0152280.1 phosphohistidine phosphatase SixA [Alcanivorax sp. S6407]
MKLFISRHGEAVGTAATDALRPLTERGREALLAHWQQLKDSGVSISNLVVSPYLRAQQTADCIAQVYGGLKRQDCDELIPEASPLLLLNWLLANPVQDNTVLVSHMPLVAQLTGVWTGSTDRIGYTVGTVACLDVDVAAAAGARLLWMCSPGESVAGR